jgi:hypothetical protein
MRSLHELHEGTHCGEICLSIHTFYLRNYKKDFNKIGIGDLSYQANFSFVHIGLVITSALGKVKSNSFLKTDLSYKRLVHKAGVGNLFMRPVT